MPDNWWEIKCIDPSSSIVAARQKCPKKVIAANPTACLPAPPLLLGERYERQKVVRPRWRDFPGFFAVGGKKAGALWAPYGPNAAGHDY